MDLSKRIRITAGSTVLALVMLFSGAAALTPSTYAANPVTAGGKATVINTDGDNIRVREDVGSQNKQVAEAHQGEVVSVLAGPRKDVKGTIWYKIKGPGGAGWIHSDFLSGKAEVSGAAKPAPAPPNITGFGKVSNTDGDNLRVRSEPSRDGSVLADLASGMSVSVKKGPVVDKDKIAWYQVSADGAIGWVMAQYLSQSQAPAQPAKVEMAAKTEEKAKPESPPANDVRSGSSRGAQPPTDNKPSGLSQSIVSTAMKYQGYRYRFGGMSPNGFDCSGFITYVVNKSGKRISRNMGAQLKSGTRVSSKELQPGDLLFFSNTYKRGLSHVGIYIGNGKFIHAQNESTGVVVSNVWSAYWASHYTAATRLR